MQRMQFLVATSTALQDSVVQKLKYFLDTLTVTYEKFKQEFEVKKSDV